MIKTQDHDTFFDQLAARLPRAKRRRFRNGVAALTCHWFISLNAAGRHLAARPATGLSRVWRLSTDRQLAGNLQQALVDQLLESRSGRVWLNIDHTKVGDFTVCVIAIQTGRGRAIPFWFQINRGGSNAAIRPLLAALEQLAGRLQSYPSLQPVLVADRWFGSSRMIDFCQTAGWGFVFRTKTDKIVDTPRGQMAIDDIAAYDSPIDYRGHRLRLILSKLRPGMNQPWWLLTNLQTGRQKLLDRYAARWEIESTFRDMKHIQGLRAVRVRQAVSLHNLLLFLSLSWSWLEPLAPEIPPTNPGKALGWFRYLYERFVCWRSMPAGGQSLTAPP